MSYSIVTVLCKRIRRNRGEKQVSCVHRPVKYQCTLSTLTMPVFRKSFIGLHETTAFVEQAWLLSMQTVHTVLTFGFRKFHSCNIILANHRLKLTTLRLQLHGIAARLSRHQLLLPAREQHSEHYCRYLARNDKFRSVCKYIYIYIYAPSGPWWGGLQG